MHRCCILYDQSKESFPTVLLLKTITICLFLTNSIAANRKYSKALYKLTGGVQALHFFWQWHSPGPHFVLGTTLYSMYLRPFVLALEFEFSVIQPILGNAPHCAQFPNQKETSTLHTVGGWSATLMHHRFHHQEPLEAGTSGLRRSEMYQSKRCTYLLNMLFKSNQTDRIRGHIHAAGSPLSMHHYTERKMF